MTRSTASRPASGTNRREVSAPRATTATRSTTSRATASRATTSSRTAERRASSRHAAAVPYSRQQAAIAPRGMRQTAMANCTTRNGRRSCAPATTRTASMGWTGGLAPAAMSQSGCPDGTIATMALGHNNITRCVPL